MTKILMQDISDHPNAAMVSWHGETYFSMLCPFHDDRNPSCLVYSTYYICKAASCARRGTLGTLKKQLDGWQASGANHPQATIKWADVLGLNGRPTDQFVAQAFAASENPGVRLWYERRGLGDMINKCQLGWWRGWFVTPVLDEMGTCLRVILRAGPTLEGQSNRYVVSPGPSCLFVPDWGLLHTRPHYMFFPFGCYDALTICKLRHPCATGAGPCTDFPIDLLNEHRRIIFIVPDGEPKEEKDKANRMAKELGWRGRVTLLDYPKNVKDPNGFLQMGRERDLVNQLAREALL